MSEIQAQINKIPGIWDVYIKPRLITLVNLVFGILEAFLNLLAKSVETPYRFLGVFTVGMIVIDMFFLGHSGFIKFMVGQFGEILSLVSDSFSKSPKVWIAVGIFIVVMTLNKRP